MINHVIDRPAGFVGTKLSGELVEIMFDGSSFMVAWNSLKVVYGIDKESRSPWWFGTVCFVSYRYCGEKGTHLTLS